MQELRLVVFVLLEDDEFNNFNFSEIHDPSLKLGSGPSQSFLYRLAHESRRGKRRAASEFGVAMYWTLRPASFESFQRVHGPRPIEYRDWYYSKLFQFLNILVYEELEVGGVGPWGGPGKPRTEEPWKEGSGILGGKGSIVQPDDIEAALVPEDNENEEVNWSRLAWRLAQAGENRFAVLQDWLRGLRERRPSEPPRRRSWAVNEERDRIISNCLRRGMERCQICEQLDRWTIATLPSIQASGIFKWTEAWYHRDHRKRVQQLFSKLRSRQKAVKPPAVSR